MVQYVQHLQDLEWSKNMRTKNLHIEAEDRKNKTVHDYDWRKLLEDEKADRVRS